MSFKLKDRINSYKDLCDYKLMARVPLIISINGRAFHKATSLLDKPFSEEFAATMLSTMNYLCHEIDGVLFAYHFNDEIVLVLRNDQSMETQAWCDNKIQKITSLSAAMATLHFNQLANATDLSTPGDNIFYSQCFSVPTIQEAINTIIFKQQANFYTCINYACFYELLKLHKDSTIKEMMKDLSADEKKDLLAEECDIDFSNYPSVFRKGAAAYKVPKIIDGKLKNRWVINKDVPIFSKENSLLSNVFNTGHDVIRGS